MGKKLTIYSGVSSSYFHCCFSHNLPGTSNQMLIISLVECFSFFILPFQSNPVSRKTLHLRRVRSRFPIRIHRILFVDRERTPRELRSCGLFGINKRLFRPNGNLGLSAVLRHPQCLFGIYRYANRWRGMNRSEVKRRRTFFEN